MSEPLNSNDSPSRRTFLQGAVSLGVASTLPGVAAKAEAPAPAFRPNIIYIHSHDTGRYTSPYGESVPTPNMMRLASEGILFRQAFSAAPTCSPSRASLLTGQCPHSNGMFGLAHLGWKLFDYGHVIIHTLAKHGYTSALAGIQHIAAKDKVATIGYDIEIPHKSELVADVMPGALKYLENAPKDKPFFLDIGFHQTHRQYPAATAEDKAEYIQPPAAVPDTPETRADMAQFHASVRQLDGGMGQLLDTLEKTGLAENTLVISTTDHGISFPRMKCSLTDDGWAVHMIVRGPKEFHGPKACNAMVSHIDVFPTICEYLGIEAPTWLEGKSFLPVLRGEKPEINEEIFSEVTYHAAYEPKRAVRTHRFKYIKRFDGRTKAVLPNTDDGISKTLWLKDGWQKLDYVHEEEMYDLAFDRHEENNLLHDPQFATELAEMRGRLNAWMKRTNDPILKGPIPLIEGGKTTPVDNISPGAERGGKKGAEEAT